MDQNNQGYEVQPNMAPQQPVQPQNMYGNQAGTPTPQMPQALMPGMPMGQPMGGYGQPGMPMGQPQQKKPIDVKTIAIVAVAVIAVIAIVLSLSSGESLTCSKSMYGYDYTYNYKFKNNKVDSAEMIMVGDVGDEASTYEEIKEQAEIVKKTYEQQHFKVSYTIDGTVVTLKMTISGDDMIKAGLVSDISANRAGTKKNMEASGMTCK